MWEWHKNRCRGQSGCRDSSEVDSHTWAIDFGQKKNLDPYLMSCKKLKCIVELTMKLKHFWKKTEEKSFLFR